MKKLRIILGIVGQLKSTVELILRIGNRIIGKKSIILSRPTSNSYGQVAIKQIKIIVKPPILDLRDRDII